MIITFNQDEIGIILEEYIKTKLKLHTSYEEISCYVDEDSIVVFNCECTSND